MYVDDISMYDIICVYIYIYVCKCINVDLRNIGTSDKLHLFGNFNAVFFRCFRDLKIRGGAIYGYGLNVANASIFPSSFRHIITQFSQNKKNLARKCQT